LPKNKNQVRKKGPKVIILMAGMGSRLGRPYPKALTPLQNGETIFSRQMRIFRETGLSCICVVGFKKDLIMESDPNTLFAYNANFDTTNTSKSLLCGLNQIEDEDVLWINGDVVFDARIIHKMLDKDESLATVNNARVQEEEVKYSLDSSGYINAISKEVENPLGEALGLNLIKSDYLEPFKQCLSRVEDDDYFEKAMELLTQEKGPVFKPLNVGELPCIEVDFQEDLDQAIQLLRKGK